MGEELIDLFDWLETQGWIGGANPLIENHQRFLDLIAGWSNKPDSFHKMPAAGWTKLYQKWLDGKLKPAKQDLEAAERWKNNNQEWKWYPANG
jgi:hypothetical protein